MGKDPCPCFTQALIIRGKAIRAQGCIAFNRRIDVPIRSVVVSLPRAVPALGVEQGLNNLLLARMRIAQEVHGQKPLRFHAAVGFQHPNPVPILGLLTVQPCRCGVNGLVEMRSHIGHSGDSRHPDSTPSFFGKLGK